LPSRLRCRVERRPRSPWLTVRQAPATAVCRTRRTPTPRYQISNWFIENAYCTASRTHCLCPGSGSGINPDNFINVVIYGPNPLPTPGPSPVDIPTLPPDGRLFTLALAVGSTTPAGTLPLHVLNQVNDTASSKPPFTALLSGGRQDRG